MYYKIEKKYTVKFIMRVEVKCDCAYSAARLCPTLCAPWTVAHQAPLSTGFSRQEYWSGLPFPPPGDDPDPGAESMSPAPAALAGRLFTTEPPGKSKM